MPKVEFDTSEFEFSHGRKPRGRGAWAFWFQPNTDNVMDAWWANGTYAEARKAAKAEAERRGVNFVMVGS